MILDKFESSIWLTMISNNSQISEDDRNDIYTMAIANPNMKVVDDIYKVDIFPFVSTMKFDILEIYELLKFGTNQYIMHWPKNGEIEFEPLENPGDMHRLMNSSDFYNRGYIDDGFIRLYHLCYDSHTQTSGGICLFIDRKTNDIRVFGIGEDDGWMFPELNNFIDYKSQGINKYELFALCSIVNDINAKGLDNQKVIENLYRLNQKFVERVK